MNRTILLNLQITWDREGSEISISKSYSHSLQNRLQFHAIRTCL